MREHLLSLTKYVPREQLAFVGCGPPDFYLIQGFRTSGFPYQPLLLRPWPGALLQVWRSLRRERPDLVHSHGYLAAVLATLAGCGRAGTDRRGLTLHRRPRHLVTIHTVVEPEAEERLSFCWRTAAAWALARADAIIAVSEAVRQDLLARFSQVASKVHVILNGVDLERLLDRPGREAVMKRLGLRGDRPKIGVVARLSPEKGVDVFLRAAEILNLEGVEADYLVVGEGPERRSLQHLAHQLGLSGQVYFVNPQPEIGPLLSILNVLAIPSRSEAFSMVAVEAALLGVPIVASAVGGLPEVLAGVQAAFVKPDDPQALAQSILRLLRTPPEEDDVVEPQDVPAEVSRWATERLQHAGYDLTGDVMAFYLASGPHLEPRVELAERFSAARMAKETYSLYLRILGLPEVSLAGD